jgi:hypothetical protein
MPQVFLLSSTRTIKIVSGVALREHPIGILSTSSSVLSMLRHATIKILEKT